MKPAPPAIARRRLLQGGAGAALVLAVGGGAARLWRPGWRDRGLTCSGRAVFRAIARVVMEGSLPGAATAQEAALERHLDRVNEVAAGVFWASMRSTGRSATSSRPCRCTPCWRRCATASMPKRSAGA